MTKFRSPFQENLPDLTYILRTSSEKLLITFYNYKKLGHDQGNSFKVLEKFLLLICFESRKCSTISRGYLSIIMHIFKHFPTEKELEYFLNFKRMIKRITNKKL